MYKNGKPIIEWYYSLKSRPPDLQTRGPQTLASDRARAADTKIVVDFFEKVKGFMQKNALWDRPENVFNCDESGNQCDHCNRVFLIRML